VIIHQVFDIVIHRYIELPQASSGKILEALLDFLGELYKFHGEFLCFVLSCWFMRYFVCLTLVVNGLPWKTLAFEVNCYVSSRMWNFTTASTLWFVFVTVVAKVRNCDRVSSFE